MKVKAMAKGQYKGVMHHAGEVFDIERPEDKERWMLEVVIAPIKVMGNMLPKEEKFHQTKEQPKTAE